MDIALCAYNKADSILQFAGAVRPIYVIRNEKVFEYKGTKNSIGGDPAVSKTFFNNNIPLLKGDTVYMFTDGYADQFGVNGKKLMTKRFKELLLNIQSLSMADQQKHLNDFIEKWKGSHEQIDDIMIMAFRV